MDTEKFKHRRTQGSQREHRVSVLSLWPSVSSVVKMIIILLPFNSLSQNQSGVRGQIDQERAQVRMSYTDPKIYEIARGFIRKDSTYYVGYMFEGAYLFFRANDELGFTLAIPSLKKALDKIEHDYDPLLKLRTNNYNDYVGIYRYHQDYGLIAYFLNRCYQNIEAQDKAMDVLRHMRARDFQLEFNLDSYNTMAWIYHRNRMFTSKQFKFLKNSVRENVAAANRCLDSAIQKLRNDAPYNNGLYDPSMLNRQYLSTFHYKAMINDYLLEIDSANYYYDVLIQNGAYSSNNYAEFKLAMGEFDEAELFFQEAADRESNVEKTTKEYYYMRGTLAIYRGHPERADSLLNDILQKQGSTPGYGWHCIGLARAQHYEGLTAESMERINKAARFQELHIGTTWGQEQYNLAVASLHYLNQLNFKKEYLFEHNEWYFWLNPVNWYRWVKYTLEIRHHKMVLASLVAENPEREQVIYSLFSPENLITFDEVWSVMEGFGNEYFIKIYQNKLATDKRPRLKKYFKYVLGKLYLAEGKDSEAIKYFEQVLQETDANDAYQTLLTARTFEGMAEATSGSERDKYVKRLYQLYPQLLPFTDFTISFRLNAQANNSAEEKILNDLQNTRIDFTDDGNVPQVSLQFASHGQSLDINYSVLWQGKVTQQGTLQLDETEKADAGKLIAYRIFGIHKSKIGEQPKATPQAKPEKKEEEKKKESTDKAV